MITEMMTLNAIKIGVGKEKKMISFRWEVDITIQGSLAVTIIIITSKTILEILEIKIEIISKV